MEKIKSLLAIVVFVCWGCSQRREQSARFSEDQISQLGLESTKQLVVLNTILFWMHIQVEMY